MPDLLRQAFREATSGTPAPVNLLFAGKEGDIEHEVADLKMIAEETFTQVPAYRPAPEAARVAEAARHSEEREAAGDCRGRRRAIVGRRAGSLEACEDSFHSRGDFAERDVPRPGKQSALHRRSRNLFALLHK